MPNGSFLQIRLAGDRFSDHSVPFDTLLGIAQFKALIVEASRLEYLKHQKRRKRIPRGFSQSIELKLTSIEVGSAQVGIGLALSGTQSLIASQESYFARGRDRLIKTIQKAGNGEKMESAEVSKKMSNGFDSIARILEDGEELHVIRPNGTANERERAVFTKEIAARIRNTSASDADVSADIETCGYISEFNQENNTFRLRLRDGTKFNPSISAELLDTALDVFNGYRRGLQAHFRGTGLKNSAGRIVEVNRITHLHIMDNPLNISDQLDDIRKLNNGWLDGEGTAPSRDGINWIESKLRMYIPSNFPPLYLYPTEAGGILIEWSIESNESSIEVDLESHIGIWHELNVQSGEDDEREFNLDQAANWQWVIDHVDRLRSVT